MKKAFKVIAIAAIAIAVLPSCKKGDVKANRLDGTWALEGGSASTSTTTLNKFTGIPSTSSKTSSYDGKLENSTTVIGAFSQPSSNPYIVEWTFSKSDNSFQSKKTDGTKYTTTVSSIYPNSSFGELFPSSSCNFADAIYGADVKVETISVSESEGVFTILGETGDIEKNSRILLEVTSTRTTETTTYAYYNGTTLLGTIFVLDGSTCKVATVSSVETSNETSVNDNGMIVTVTEMDKESMSTEMEINEVFEDSNSKSTTTGTSTFDYAKK